MTEIILWSYIGSAIISGMFVTMNIQKISEDLAKKSSHMTQEQVTFSFVTGSLIMTLVPVLNSFMAVITLLSWATTMFVIKKG